MPTEPEFHSIEFFRKIRDQQAAAFSGKTPAEIIAFFPRYQPNAPAGRVGKQRVHEALAGNREMAGFKLFFNNTAR